MSVSNLLLTYYINQANIKLNEYQLANKFRAKTGISSLYVIIGCYLIFSISIFFNIGGSFSSGLLATIYPFYCFLDAYASGDVWGIKKWGLYFGILSLYGLFEFMLIDISYYFAIKSAVCLLIFDGVIIVK